MSDSERTDAREWLVQRMTRAWKESRAEGKTQTVAASMLDGVLSDSEARPYLYQMLGPDTGDGYVNRSEKLEVVRDVFEDWVFDRATPGQVFDQLYQLLGVREQPDADV